MKEILSIDGAVLPYSRHLTSLRRTIIYAPACFLAG